MAARYRGVMSDGPVRGNAVRERGGRCPIGSAAIGVGDRVRFLVFLLLQMPRGLCCAPGKGLFVVAAFPERNAKAHCFQVLDVLHYTTDILKNKAQRRQNQAFHTRISFPDA